MRTAEYKGIFGNIAETPTEAAEKDVHGEWRYFLDELAFQLRVDAIVELCPGAVASLQGKTLAPA